jgi:phosphoglycerate dehydrogenase-like enzyme
MAILMNHKISLTPHIGAATGEAQDRIGWIGYTKSLLVFWANVLMK